MDIHGVLRTTIVKSAKGLSAITLGEAIGFRTNVGAFVETQCKLPLSEANVAVGAHGF